MGRRAGGGGGGGGGGRRFLIPPYHFVTLCDGAESRLPRADIATRRLSHSRDPRPGAPRRRGAAGRRALRTSVSAFRRRGAFARSVSPPDELASCPTPGGLRARPRARGRRRQLGTSGRAVAGRPGRLARRPTCVRGPLRPRRPCLAAGLGKTGDASTPARRHRVDGAPAVGGSPVWPRRSKWRALLH